MPGPVGAKGGWGRACACACARVRMYLCEPAYECLEELRISVRRKMRTVRPSTESGMDKSIPPKVSMLTNWSATISIQVAATIKPDREGRRGRGNTQW